MSSGGLPTSEPSVLTSRLEAADAPAAIIQSFDDAIVSTTLNGVIRS
jgi:hypothetical protein